MTTSFRAPGPSALRPLGAARVATVLPMLVGLLSLSGCSGVLPEQEQPFPGQEPSVRIVVTATESRYIGMTVYLNSARGFRQRMGALSVGGRETFLVRDIRPGPHFLEGRAQGTAEIRSREFMLRGGDAVEWDVDANDVFYRAVDDSGERAARQDHAPSPRPPLSFR